MNSLCSSFSRKAELREETARMLGTPPINDTTPRRNGRKATPLRRKRVLVRLPDGLRIAGVPWPAGWIPEEPLTGYTRKRDDCFRWRVEDLLYVNGWTFWHITDPRRSDAGPPDLFCFRERIIYL